MAKPKDTEIEAEAVEAKSTVQEFVGTTEDDDAPEEEAESATILNAGHRPGRRGTGVIKRERSVKMGHEANRRAKGVVDS